MAPRTLPNELPRRSIGFFPTPLHRLDNISAQTGYDVYIKRDDFTGRNLYGGNKIRKLEYLMGYALEQGCDYVITYGATQSNHAMQTITAARICGLNPVVYLHSVVDPDPDDLRANLLLDSIYGAEVHIVYEEEGNPLSAKERAALAGEARMKELEAQGHKVYNVPVGGSNEVGVCGYINGYLELMDQLDAMGKHMDYLFTTTGSGGTLGGLVAGKVLSESDTKIIGVCVSPKADGYSRAVTDLANRGLEHCGADCRATTEDFEVDGNFYGEGYEIPAPAATAAIRRLAASEGILLDPVYTGKAFSGMLAYLDQQKLPKGSTVVFLHTGGTTALFAEHAIVGPVNEDAK
ncbi:MAG: pyridoxal-phosphate dependent enzyme [Firmicutes bacterium]|nr:pyridoxal-phosphate dependent enzyme [Bacillota bacterium]